MDGKLTQSLRGSLGSTDGADRKNKVARWNKTEYWEGESFRQWEWQRINSRKSLLHSQQKTGHLTCLKKWSKIGENQFKMTKGKVSTAHSMTERRTYSHQAKWKKPHGYCIENSEICKLNTQQ
jgi:hypothetical protein